MRKESQKRAFAYAEDSWRVTPNLTLNLWCSLGDLLSGNRQWPRSGRLRRLDPRVIFVLPVSGPSNTAMSIQKDFNLLGSAHRVCLPTRPRTVIRGGYGRSLILESSVRSSATSSPKICPFSQPEPHQQRPEHGRLQSRAGSGSLCFPGHPIKRTHPDS